jgi:hypothetical protein
LSKASRDKGKRYELKVANYLTDAGIAAKRRVEQWRSGGDDLLTDLDPWLSVECKDVAAKSVGAWLDQSLTSAGPDRLAVVIHHRRGNGNVAHDFATLRLDHLVELLHDAKKGRTQ